MEPGTQLGRYEILSPLGQGGMGEVWRARDTRLGREVAIKMLPGAFACDPQRLARLEREARMLASTNHPNIAVIHDLEQSDETRFLSLELVEGGTLAERIALGPIPVGDALKLALQIAEALEAAHEHGVVHRDLTPSNIKLTPGDKVKVLDFGLAKAFDVGGRNDPPTPTLTAPERGAIRGTAAYMAPEQARGDPVDARADVWAFGCVLFEMLTGQAAFGGETASDVLATVLKVDPNWSHLPRKLHPRIREVLERCLEKQRRDRYHGISDARVEIEKALADPRGLLVEPSTESRQARQRRRILLAVSVLGALLVSGFAAGVSVWHLKPSPAARLMHFVEELPHGPPASLLSLPMVAVSRDGTRIAYVAGDEMIAGQMNVRMIDDARSARAVGGAAGLIGQPQFSPNGQWLAYFAPPHIVRVPVGGGIPQPIVTTPPTHEPVRGLHWDDSGLLVYAHTAGIHAVPAAGGEPRLVVAAGDGEVFASPSVLPGGDAILFSVAAGSSAVGWDSAEIVLHSLSSGQRRVVASGRDARYVRSGHVVYAQGNALYAVPFDPVRLAVTGAPVQVQEGIVRAAAVNSDSAQYAVSDTGTLVYLENPAARPSVPRRSLVWVDRDGRREPIRGIPPDEYTMVRVSPDGRKVAIVLGDVTQMRLPDLWVLDLETGNLRQLTFGRGADAPVWSHNSRRIYFRSSRANPAGVYSVSADGGDPELLAPSSPEFSQPLPWSLAAHVQTLVLVNVISIPGDIGLAALGLGPEGELRRLLHDAQPRNQPVFSPNGQWIAYELAGDDRTARISIRPYPEVRRQAIRGPSGRQPVFSPGGDELYFLDGDALQVVTVRYEPTFGLGVPRELFRGPYAFDVAPGRAWDLHPDGDRFLMLEADSQEDDDGASPEGHRLHVLVNWVEDLRQRSPAR